MPSAPDQLPATFLGLHASTGPPPCFCPLQQPVSPSLGTDPWLSPRGPSRTPSATDPRQKHGGALSPPFPACVSHPGGSSHLCAGPGGGCPLRCRRRFSQYTAGASYVQLRGLWLLWAQVPDSINRVQGTPWDGVTKAGLSSPRGAGAGLGAAFSRHLLHSGPSSAVRCPPLPSVDTAFGPPHGEVGGLRGVGLRERTSPWAAAGPARQTGACRHPGMGPERVGLGEERQDKRGFRSRPPAPAAPTRLGARKPLRVPSLDFSETESWGVAENPHWAWGGVLAVPRKVRCDPKFRWWGKAETTSRPVCRCAPPPEARAGA